MEAMEKEKRALDGAKNKADVLINDYHHRIASLHDRIKHAPTINDTVVVSSLADSSLSMDEHAIRKAMGAMKYHTKSTLVSKKSRRKPTRVAMVVIIVTMAW